MILSTSATCEYSIIIIYYHYYIIAFYEKKFSPINSFKTGDEYKHKWMVIALGHDLSPVKRQALAWTNDDLWLFGA